MIATICIVILLSLCALLLVICGIGLCVSGIRDFRDDWLTNILLLLCGIATLVSGVLTGCILFI